jgi:hypothetical protein
MSRWITIYKTPRLFEPLWITINGNLVNFRFSKCDKRLDVPTIVYCMYWDDGYTPYSEEWFSEGELHREYGSARIAYHDPKECEYYYNGTLSRLDGPAYVRWVPGIGKYGVEWVINGTGYTKAEHANLINSTRKIMRRWLMWRKTKIRNCWRWINSIDGQIHFFREGGAGRKAHIRELNNLQIKK